MRDLFDLVRWSLMLARRRAWIARRDHRSAAFLFYSAVAGLGEIAAVTTALSLFVACLAIGAHGAAIVVAAIALVLILPGPLARHVAVPRGQHRAAYWLVMIDELGRAGAERPARLVAARAAARVGSSPEATAWLAALRKGRLDATETAVQAILAHGRGDRDDARALFTSLAAFADPAPEARELAAEWLALDDAERGAWAELVARGRLRARPGRGAHRSPDAIRHAKDPQPEAGEPLWPATSMTYLLEGVGARLLGDDDAPSDANLWLRWLEAPARRATWGLVREAIARGTSTTKVASRSTAPSTTTSTSTQTSSTTTGSTAPSTSAATPASPAGPPSAATAEAAADDRPPTALELALRAHAQALRDGTIEAVAAAAQAWDATASTPGLAIAVARRAIALGAAPDAGDRAMVELDEQIIGELADLIDQRALPLPALHARAPGSALLAAIARRARRELLTRLELTCDRIGDRTHEQRPIDAIDELRTFVAVRRAYEEAAAQGGPELERLAFPHVHAELLQWTVWLWNERKEHFLSHLVTAWLFERALAVGDAEAIELHGANGAIRIPGR
ncbi:MAG TPA: hypothetical protein VHE35_06270 [Kofleriaceae bacterium]|nr:hypothetical protein [Kofleriaceae bacterium]